MTISPDRLYEMGGVPVGNPIQPTFGNCFFVDTTNGDDTNGDGLLPSTALATVTAGITAQTALTGSLGDIIYVMYGNYTGEEITGALTACQLIGATACGGNPEGVSIRPDAGAAYTGVMTNAAIRNMDFRSSSGTNKDYAALELTDMWNSTVDGCIISAGADDANSKGLLVGSNTEAASEFMFNSAITNNFFTTFGARGNEFMQALRIGNGSTNIATRKFSNSVIADNRIFAESQGIILYTGATNNPASIITRNHVASNQGQISVAGISSNGATDLLVLVTKNYVRAVDAIYGFTAACVFDNWVANDETVAIEGPAMV